KKSDNSHKNFQVSENENMELNDEIKQFEKHEDINEEEETTIELDSLNEELEESKFENNHSTSAFDAKWSLETLFDKDSLKLPAYLNLLLK
ncbi:4391_t:CDS:2, partial [Cetraspora pellucida]